MYQDACIEDKRQYRAPHLPNGLLLAAMSRVDSEKSSSETSSSRESEDEVQCLMADGTDEVFDFCQYRIQTRGPCTTLNDMVQEYKKLTQSFEEVKAERESCATKAELVSSSDMSSASLDKLHGAMKPSGDKIGLGYNSNENSTSKTICTPQLERIKFQTMNFVKSSTGQLIEAQSVEDKIADEPLI
ncbi:hypothetical protein F511_18699 [Dorcoceras hygrometricum]|uniref:Uncharacterized protein n=1 Tax=Dorcoceras hygrometricum TaxID=472368 RepID=A0A2Z7BW90_9LAMI|nr:hypothetical protein F511_18699 [Dorcoceras hygrometricum]